MIGEEGTEAKYSSISKAGQGQSSFSSALGPLSCCAVRRMPFAPISQKKTPFKVKITSLS